MSEEKVTKVVEEVEGEEEEKKETGPFEKIILGTMVINGIPIDPRDDFFVDTSHFYGIYQTNVIPTEAIEYHVKWVAIDAFAEKNREIFTMNKKYDPSQDTAFKDVKRKDFSILFDLNNQARALVAGKYRIDVKIGDKPAFSKEFDLIHRKGLYLGTRYDQFGIVHPAQKFRGHTHTIWGMYHFHDMKANTEIESGKIEWIKLTRKDEKKEEDLNNLDDFSDDKMVFEFPIEVKPGQKFNVFRFRLPKKTANGFDEGYYKCVVFVNGEQAAQKIFKILKPLPTLFLGTQIDRTTVDMLDDRVIFPGTTRIVKGIYKFCEKIPKEKVAEVKWYLEQPLGMARFPQPRMIATHPVKCQSDYDVMVFQLNVSKLPSQVPGVYSCEVILDKKVQKKRLFRMMPKYEILLGEPEQNGEVKKRKNHYPEGTQEVKGMFQANVIFPQQSTFRVVWIATSVNGVQKPQVLTESRTVMKKPFRNCSFMCSLKKPFPVGVYQTSVFVNDTLVANEVFKVLKKNDYDEFLKKKKELTQQLMQKLQVYQQQMKQKESQAHILNQMKGKSIREHTTTPTPTPINGEERPMSPTMGVKTTERTTMNNLPTMNQINNMVGSNITTAANNEKKEEKKALDNLDDDDDEEPEYDI